MEHRIFFTSPIDHDTLDSWPGLGKELQQVVQTSCGNSVNIKLGKGPVFGYGIDGDEVLDAMESDHLDPWEVRIDLWSSIRAYSILCFSLGSAITRSKRRGLIRHLKKKILRQETLLEDHEGPYYPDSRHVYAYSLPTDDDRALSTLHHLLQSFDPPVYLGENWLLMGKDEQIDLENYEILAPVGSRLSLFITRQKDADEVVWKASAAGEGLVVLFDSQDPAIHAIAGRFNARRDLQTLLTLGPWSQRVTLHRCHPDDHLALIYAPAHEPYLDEPVVFVI